jgi:hypothetical protein
VAFALAAERAGQGWDCFVRSVKKEAFFFGKKEPKNF